MKNIISNTSGIYIITNIITNKIYIGSSSKSIRYRIYDHKTKLRKNEHRNSLLQNAYNKYTEINFKFEVLELCEKEKCIEREQYWIDTLNACDKRIGYNLAPMAGSSLGQKRTEEQKLNISVSVKGKRKGNLNNRFGIKWSNETRIKILNKLEKFNKPVLQYDLNMNLINEFKSINDAEKYLGKTNSQISKVCRKVYKHKTAYGFIWEFKN